LHRFFGDPRSWKKSARESRSANIVKGLFLSVLKRVMEMDLLSDQVVMTGGVVAYNPYLVTMMGELIKAADSGSGTPQLTGALGAALLALETST